MLYNVIYIYIYYIYYIYTVVLYYNMYSIYVISWFSESNGRTVKFNILFPAGSDKHHPQ